MERLKIGDTIVKLRREKKITQEKLADFIGVTTAAVSKWESGASYPDITLIPLLAAYFNVTTDELLNYKKDLSEDDVMKIYIECEKSFEELGWDKWSGKCKEYIKKYSNSYFLKFKIAYLKNMYAATTLSEEIVEASIKESIEIYEDIVENSFNSELIEGSLFQLGCFYGMVGKKEEAIEALKKIHKPVADPDIILSGIYVEENRLDEANKLLQKNLFEYTQGIINTIGLLVSACYKEENIDFEKAEKYLNLSLSFKKLFSPKGDSLFKISMDYIEFANLYLKWGKKEKCFKLLNEMVEELEKNDINKREKIEDIWAFSSLSTAENNMQINLYENIKIILNARFESIKESDEFKYILNKIEKLNKDI